LNFLLHLPHTLTLNSYKVSFLLNVLNKIVLDVNSLQLKHAWIQPSSGKCESLYIYIRLIIGILYNLKIINLNINNFIK